MSAPHRVIPEPPELDSDAHGFWLAALFHIASRTLIAWGVIAILIPQFGITYWMVYLGIVGFHAVRGPGPYALIHSMNRVTRKASSSKDIAPSDTPRDNVLLVARSKA